MNQLVLLVLWLLMQQMMVLMVHWNFGLQKIAY
jgi:hypothetical protein